MAGSRAGSPMSRLSPNVLTFERPASFICHWATTPLVHKPRVFVKSYFTTTDLCKNLERVGIIIARSCHWSHRRITEGFPLVSVPTLDLSIYDQKSDWVKGFCYLMKVAPKMEFSVFSFLLIGLEKFWLIEKGKTSFPVK